MLSWAIYLDTLAQFPPLKNVENNVCVPCALWCNNIFTILNTRLNTAQSAKGFEFVSFQRGHKRALKTSPRMCNISVPEQDLPVSSCPIGKAQRIFMKQANKLTQRVWKLPSVPSFISSYFKLSEVGQAEGSQKLVFRMKMVSKWQSRFFSLGRERQVGV